MSAGEAEEMSDVSGEVGNNKVGGGGVMSTPRRIDALKKKIKVVRRWEGWVVNF